MHLPNTRSLMAQAGLDHHKEAALQHAVRSYAVAERKGARHDVPDPPSFARPAIEPQGPGGSEVAKRPETRRVLLNSEARSFGWKPRVRLWQATCMAFSCMLLFSLCVAATLCRPAQEPQYLLITPSGSGVPMLALQAAAGAGGEDGACGLGCSENLGIWNSGNPKITYTLSISCTPGQVAAVEPKRMYVVTLWLPGWRTSNPYFNPGPSCIVLPCGR